MFPLESLSSFLYKVVFLLISARVADAGNLSHVKLVVRGEQNQAGAEIASVRRKIGAYYGVEERDIEVDVERE